MSDTPVARIVTIEFLELAVGLFCTVTVIVAFPVPLLLLNNSHVSELDRVQFVFDVMLKVPLAASSELTDNEVNDILRYD